MTSTELLGANQMVTTVNPPVLSRKLFCPHRFSNATWGPGAVPGERTDVCGFGNPRTLVENGRSPRETLGLRPKDQSCHHEVWLHLDLVGNQSSGSSSKKGPAHTRLTRRKADTGCAASIGPPASPQTRNGPLLVPFFRSGWAPLVGLGVRNVGGPVLAAHPV